MAYFGSRMTNAHTLWEQKRTRNISLISILEIIPSISEFPEIILFPENYPQKTHKFPKFSEFLVREETLSELPVPDSKARKLQATAIG